MGHRLLAVDVLPGAHRIDHDLPMPVIGHGGNNAIDVLVVEQLLVSTRHREIRPNDLAGESVATIVEVARGRALDAVEPDRGAKQVVALHADADHAKANAIARREPTGGGKGGERRRAGERRAGDGGGADAKKLPT